MILKPNTFNHCEQTLLQNAVTNLHVIVPFMLLSLFIRVSKSNSFCINMQNDWLEKLAPLFDPITSKTKTNCNSLVHVFPHFISATCIFYAFCWFIGLSVAFVIGQSDYLMVLVLRYSIENCSMYKKTIKH